VLCWCGAMQGARDDERRHGRRGIDTAGCRDGEKKRLGGSLLWSLQVIPEHEPRSEVGGYDTSHDTMSNSDIEYMASGLHACTCIVTMHWWWTRVNRSLSPLSGLQQSMIGPLVLVHSPSVALMRVVVR